MAKRPLKAEQRTVQLGEASVPFTLERKNRKTLSVRVRPGPRVEVSAPQRCTDAQIMAFLEDRAGWIAKKMDFIAQHQPPTLEPRYVPGEVHAYLGRHYTLEVVQHIQQQVRIEGEALLVYSHAPRDPALSRKLVEDWFRKQARALFRERLDVCLRRFEEPETFRPKRLSVRTMRSRWGSMSRDGRMSLNQHLLRGPLAVTDLVITHELCHIAHPNHGKGFYGLLAQVMPDW
ncbi:MAG: SprT family zinc-dependent metalloprotease, partial [Alphaproteobacteria bacterium]|nr:SprT family zinc-dependent metalloprotease [Alphaproteobacteria bacterium]